MKALLSEGFLLSVLASDKVDHDMDLPELPLL
jgi:hypothetical protein